MRALFEIVLRKGWSLMTGRLLTLSKVIEHQLWEWEHPLRQFSELRPELLNKIENGHLSIERIKEMEGNEIGMSVFYMFLFKTFLINVGLVMYMYMYITKPDGL